ncbi:MAG: glycosyl hydrolase family 28-related protein [Planctomycetota bacterium]
MHYPARALVQNLALAPLVALGAIATDALADAPIPSQYISVGDYTTGTDNDRINAAIAAAMLTTHKTVYFPNGTYELRTGIQLNQGANTEIHLIGESRSGVSLVPDVTYLEANYNGGSGSQLAHLLNLDDSTPFTSVDVTIQNMTLDMQDQRILGETVTYKTAGHGVRIGEGWQSGQFTVNHLTMRNIASYGVGIQDRGGHPKNNVTLTNLHIERTGSDGIDTKEASGDGNRNLVIRDVSINEIGFLDTGAANAIDVRYRDATIENVNLVSERTRSTLPGQSSNNGGIHFRPFEPGAAGIAGFDVSDVYARGFNNAITISSNSNAQHQNIDITDFKVQGHHNGSVTVLGTNHSGHTISDGYVDPASGNAVSANGQATVTNVTNGRWHPALTPATNTSFEDDVSLAGDVYSPAWEGYVGTERVALNPNGSGTGPFVFDITNTGELQIDFDTQFNAMDRLVVAGELKLDGELSLNTIGGTPDRAASFTVLEADTITGSFDTVTLPTPATGLTWYTGNLESEGTLALGRVNATTVGDTNTTYDSSSPDDNPPVDAAFEADLQAISGSWTFKGLDEAGKNDVRAMTLSFDTMREAQIGGAWIVADIRTESGFSNDSMRLDSTSNVKGISSMDGYNAGGGTMTLTYHLASSEFGLLTDGDLNLAFIDDIRVDNVTLNWLDISESVTLGDANTTYDSGSSDDNPYVDADFEADLQAISGSWNFKGLDEAGRNDVRAMTFTFDELPADVLSAVWIEAKIKTESGFSNDNMVLDAVGTNRKINTMDGYNAAGGDMTLIYDFDPSEFELLADGELNLAFFDDIRVDWVTLNWVQGEAGGPVIVPVLLEGIPGDANGDSVVDLLDFDLMAGNFGAVTTAGVAGGDFNGDGVVNLLDFDVLANNYGASNPSTVPEPASVMLLSLASALASRRWRG